MKCFTCDVDFSIVYISSIYVFCRSPIFIPSPIFASLTIVALPLPNKVLPHSSICSVFSTSKPIFALLFLAFVECIAMGVPTWVHPTYCVLWIWPTSILVFFPHTPSHLFVAGASSSSSSPTTSSSFRFSFAFHLPLCHHFLQCPFHSSLIIPNSKPSRQRERKCQPCKLWLIHVCLSFTFGLCNYFLIVNNIYD